MSLFFATIAALEKEKVLRYSEQGPFVVQILQLLKEQQKQSVVGMVMKLIIRLESCLNAGAKYRLPSASQKKIWSSFHAARFDQAVIRVWDDYMLAMKLPEVVHAYTSLAFQLIFDRLMKALISSQKNDLVTPTQARPMPVLSLREKNVVEYMGGGGFIAQAIFKERKQLAASAKTSTIHECPKEYEG